MSESWLDDFLVWISKPGNKRILPFKLYDTVFSFLFNIFYDVLHLSSGRDKLLAFIQNFCKYQNGKLEANSEKSLTYLRVHDSLSSSRKAFRFLKWVREVYKIRRGIDRFESGYEQGGLKCIPAVCGVMDVCGHSCSFGYYLIDNILWGASVGIFTIPKSRDSIWIGGWQARQGPMVTWLGGVAQMNTARNYFSFCRTAFGFAANVLLLFQAARKKWNETRRWLDVLYPETWDDPVLFHSLEIVCITVNMRILLSQLGYRRFKLSNSRLGLLGMIAAVTGMWRIWRKVLSKKFGARSFELRGSFLFLPSDDYIAPSTRQRKD